MDTSESTTISDHADVQALPSTEDVFYPSIPTELQIQVFSFACTDSDTVATDILSFARVCRSWRHVIYSTPQFWTRLRLDWKQYCKGARVSYGETPPISEWIERAGLHALALAHLSRKRVEHEQVLAQRAGVPVAGMAEPQQ